MKIIKILRNYLTGYIQEISWVELLIVIIIAIGFIILHCYKQGKKGNITVHKLFSVILINIYIITVLILTILGRRNGVISSICAADLFRTYQQVFLVRSKYAVYEIVFNIILFIPMGVFILDNKSKVKQKLMVCFLIVLSIEILQFMSGRGLFEVCDLIDCSLGCLLGVVMKYIYFVLYDIEQR